MSVAELGQASLATIPIGTIGTFGPDTTNPLVAEITRSGMFLGCDRLLHSFLVEVSFEISVNDGVEGVLDGVGFRALIPQQARGTEIIIGTVLIISFGETIGVDEGLPCT